MIDVGLQSLQAAWFSSGGPIKCSASELYQSIIGEPAAATQSSTAAGVSVATGAQGPRYLRVQSSPGRIDYFLSSAPQVPQFMAAEARSSSFDLLPNVNETIDAFVANCEKGSALVGEAIRIALVASTSQKAESSAAVSKILATRIGLSLPFDDGTDLLFQINRRKQLSSVADVEANRVVKWVGELVQQITIGPIGPDSKTLASGQHLATLSVDLNTVPTGRILSVDEQLLIFKELAVEAKRLSAASTLSALGSPP